MITCDMCGIKIRTTNNVPIDFSIKSIRDICGTCDKDLRADLHKIDVESVAYRNTKLKNAIDKIKENKK